MTTMTTIKRRLRVAGLVITGAVALSVAGAIAYASVPDAGGTFHGCYESSGMDTPGQLRVVDPSKEGSAGSCTAGETPISWNQTGPAGAQGPQGATGDQGPKGDKGDKGDPGTPDVRVETFGVNETISNVQPTMIAHFGNEFGTNFMVEAKIDITSHNGGDNIHGACSLMYDPRGSDPDGHDMTQVADTTSFGLDDSDQGSSITLLGKIPLAGFGSFGVVCGTAPDTDAYETQQGKVAVTRLAG